MTRDYQRQARERALAVLKREHQRLEKRHQKARQAWQDHHDAAGKIVAAHRELADLLNSGQRPTLEQISRIKARADAAARHLEQDPARLIDQEFDARDQAAAMAEVIFLVGLQLLPDKKHHATR